MKLLRTRYVTLLWSRAGTSCLGHGLSPNDFGWCIKNDVLKPVWFKGQAMPDSLFRKGIESTEVTDSDDIEEKITVGNDRNLQSSDEEISDSDDEAWSGDSDSNLEEDD